MNRGRIVRELNVQKISEAIETLCIETNVNLGEDVLDRLCEAKNTETSPIGRTVLEKLVINARIARSEEIAICQDTGFAVVFLEIGQDVHLVGGNLTEAIDKGIRRGYQKGFLRNSIVSDPIQRKNTRDNTPCVLHTDIIPGDRVRILFAPKGGGAENMSGIRMLSPSSGIEGVKTFIVEQVRKAGANPCPPVVVGAGIGGTFEKCALLAKKALFRKMGTRHADPFYAKLEQELIDAINDLGIGPAGFGGRTTALDVFIETYPCHIASLPVAVNLQCHAARHGEVTI